MIQDEEIVYSTLPLPKDGLLVDGYSIDDKQVFDMLSSVITEERKQNIEQVVSARTNHVIPVLEDIYDRGNINAVMRSAEAFGFYNLHIIDKEGARHKDSNRITKGTHKWLNIHKHSTTSGAVRALKKRGVKIYCTSLESSRNIAEFDFTEPSALVFGNEKEGVSQEMQDLADGNCIVPMEGFAQSFNISVAAAICFYHVYLQRVQKLGKNGDLSEADRSWLRANYYIKSFGSLEKFKKLVVKLKEEL